MTGPAVLVVIINHTASGLERLSDSAHPSEAPQQSPWQDGNVAVAGREAQMPSGLELPADEVAVMTNVPGTLLSSLHRLNQGLTAKPTGSVK